MAITRIVLAFSFLTCVLCTVAEGQHKELTSIVLPGESPSGENVTLVTGEDVPIEYCRTGEDLDAAVDEMYDEFISYGITDAHADQYASWIRNDIIVEAKENEGVKCIPPERSDEMGTGLGKIIAQDIAGESPAKRGRRSLREALEEEISLTYNEEIPSATYEIEDETRMNDSERQDEDVEGIAMHVERKAKAVRERAMRGLQKRLSPFKFDGNDRDESFVRHKCCKCPSFHYPKVERKKCPVGPCCPNLCRTLARLAGPLRSARLPCCNKANRNCLSNTRFFSKIKKEPTKAELFSSNVQALLKKKKRV